MKCRAGTLLTAEKTEQVTKVYGVKALDGKMDRTRIAIEHRARRLKKDHR